MISVCIPTFNYGRFIAQAVESVLAQDHEDFELIVVDNASEDDTQAVLARYDDPRLRLVVNPRNLGLFGNFARCLELASGAYVKFLASDDWLHPAYLREAAAQLDEHPSAAIASGPGYYVGDDGAVFGLGVTRVFAPGLVRGRDALLAQARHLNVVGMPSNTLLRRSALDAVGGFDAAMAPAADVHLWGKLLARYDLAWMAHPRSFLRFHQVKAHDYGHDPSESTFRLWEDLGRTAGVPEEVVRVALDAEAERSLLHASQHLLGRDLAGARRIFAFTAPHVGAGRALGRFALRLPLNARAQAARVLAARTGRMVVYAPLPRLGPPLDSARS